MIIVDASGVLAAIEPRQAYHAVAADVLTRPGRRLLSPFVLAELDYLIARNSGQTEASKLLADVARGVYQLEPFSAADIADCIAVIRRYTDLQIGLADASIVVLAARHHCYDVLTLDQRHFRAVRGPRGKAFRLLPLDAG